MVSGEIDVNRLPVGIEPEDFVPAMGDWIDDWCIRVSSSVAAQAEPITWQNGFHGVRVVTIETHHAPAAHPAPKKGAIFIVFVMNLAVRVIPLRTVNQHQVEMV